MGGVLQHQGTLMSTCIFLVMKTKGIKLSADEQVCKDNSNAIETG